MKFKDTIMSGFLCLSIGGVFVACVKKNEPAAVENVQQQQEALADRLDELENEWIRLKAKSEGKSDLGAELRVLRDEIDEGMASAKKSIDELDDSTEDERDRLERDVKNAISDLERSIEQLRRDLG